MVKDFADLIGSWPKDGERTSIQTFAADIGVKYVHAARMRCRNSVPLDYWPRILAAASKRRVGKWLTLELLARLGQQRRKRVSVRPRQRAEAAREAA
jgi:hypothetical protein